MLYYTKIEMGEGCWKYLQNLNEIHKITMSAFGQVKEQEAQNKSRQHHGVLYRINDRNILMQSKTKPNTDILKTIGETTSKRINIDKIENNMHLQISVRVNPTYKMSKTKQIKPIVGFDSIKEWIDQKLNENGAVAKYFSINETKFLSVKKRDHGFKFLAADVTALIEVVDKNKFVECVQNGIGREKSYGCGMITFAPTHRAKK